jgi:hypothetical protein
MGHDSAMAAIMTDMRLVRPCDGFLGLVIGRGAPGLRRTGPG